MEPHDRPHSPMRSQQLLMWLSLAKLKPALDRFLSAINEIEEDSRAVLEILVDAMNASHGL